MQKVKNDLEIRNLGMKSLIDTLGYASMVRFLRQFTKGGSDYLELQEKIFKGMSVDEIFEKAKSIMKENREKDNAKPETLRRAINTPKAY